MIVTIAKSYIGKKEKPGNSGFQDPVFESEMKAEGWQTSWAWCAIFTKLIAKKAISAKAKEFNRLFNPSAVKTFNNFKNAGYTISSKPYTGFLVIWQQYINGQPQWTGHAGIVSEVIDEFNFKSIEGNTSANGSRNGDRVAEQLRSTAVKKNGLNVLGFVKLEA